MRIAAEVKLSCHSDRRRLTRFDTSLDGAVCGNNDVHFRADVVNISSHGCRIELKGELPEAEPAQLKLGSAGFFSCRVVWSKVGSAGLEFLQPLDPALVHRLIAPPSRLAEAAYLPVNH